MKKVNSKILIGLISILSFVLNACSFTGKTSTRLLNIAANKQYDIVVVPGVPLENGSWSKVMKARIYWSKFLFDKGIAKNIMYSGSAVHSPFVEAEIMAMYAEAIGIPRKHIYVESKAEHSTQNIAYSYELAQKLNFETVALASDPFQTKMLQRFTRRNVSKDIDLIPIVMDTFYRMTPFMIDPIIDSKQAYVENFVALKEREGFWKRIKGTIGLDINKVYYQ